VRGSQGRTCPRHSRLRGRDGLVEVAIVTYRATVPRAARPPRAVRNDLREDGNDFSSLATAILVGRRTTPPSASACMTSSQIGPAFAPRRTARRRKRTSCDEKQIRR
jgi:hypothetical protein